MKPIRYRLRTLLLVLAVAPPLLALAVMCGHPGPSIAIGFVLIWTYDVAAGIFASVHDKK